jgi:hypothetical protein
MHVNLIQNMPVTQYGSRTAVLRAGLTVVISDFEQRERGQATVVAA